MWKQEFEQLLPKLGHRNWILVVDQAYPLQSAQGILTIDTEQPLPAILKELVNMLNQAPHVKPIYYTDLELQIGLTRFALEPNRPNWIFSTN